MSLKLEEKELDGIKKHTYLIETEIIKDGRIY